MANGAEACEKALNQLGVKRLGVLTPYGSVTSDHVVRFFNEAGFEVVAQKDLNCPSAVSIAHVTVEECREALLEVNSNEVEAIVQCGTDLNMVRLADEAERWLGKPVLAINAAIWVDGPSGKRHTGPALRLRIVAAGILTRRITHPGTAAK